MAPSKMSLDCLPWGVRMLERIKNDGTVYAIKEIMVVLDFSNT